MKTISKKSRKKLKKFAEDFDSKLIAAIEVTLGVSFSELDMTKFSVADGPLDLLLYDGVAVAMMVDGVVSSVKDYR